jgi:GTP cyclohydrolase II
MHEAQRGLFDLRQGRALYVTVPGAAGSVVATVDGLGIETLDTLRSFGVPRLAVTHRRAASMGLTERGSGDGAPQAISMALNGEGPDEILHLASARGPLEGARPDSRAASAGEVGGMTLARLGRLLPAVVAVPVEAGAAPALRQALADGAVLSVTAAQVAEMADNVGVEVVRVSDGPVPLPEAEDARFILYREANGLREHVAVLIGPPERWPDPVPVRIHSACLTGDLFGSLRCDCGEQLRRSVRLFVERGGGALLYMAQEGRDIGLANKLRAYRLQAEGLDTIDADATLGFGADERGYGAAVEILRTLGVRRVLLLTNNPDKVAALGAAGVDVVDRQPLFGTLNPHNRPYVAAKVDRAGHWLHEMLAGADPAREPRN